MADADHKVITTGTKEKNSRKKSSSRLILRLFLLAFCAFIGYRSFKLLKLDMDKKADLKRLEERMQSYREQIATELPELCRENGAPVTGTYTAEGFAELVRKYYENEAEFYDVTISYAVTLHVDGDFDELDDRSKYEMLVDLYPRIGPAHDKFLEKYFPEFGDHMMEEVYQNYYVGYKLNGYETYIQTPEHLYQYSQMYADMYFVDGESCFLADEDSKWNKKRAKSGTGSQGGSSGKSKKYGSGSYDYKDADDYADEYAEYYMEDGLDYDDAYDEAYDDWGE